MGKMEMNLERYTKLNKAGDLNAFIESMVEKTGLEYNVIFKALPNMVDSMRYDIHKIVFRYHYMYKESIISIHYETGLAYSRIEKYLGNAEKHVEKELIKCIK